jgi:3-hydroxyacyl-CoA dehydrogenase/enoyl-CoA hydratase/3-hydroxybutyryl-CoA epimerase
VHALVDSDAELMPAARAWIDSVQGNAEACQHPWDRKGYKMPGGTPSNPAIAQGLVVAPAMLKKTTRGLYPAPEAALARWSKARRWTSTPRCASKAATWPA